MNLTALAKFVRGVSAYGEVACSAWYALDALGFIVADEKTARARLRQRAVVW